MRPPGDPSFAAASDTPLEPEDALLLACARAALGQPISPPEPGPVRWPELARRIRSHGLVGILFPVVQRWFGADLPERVDEAMLGMVRQQAAHNLKIAGALSDIDAVLRAAGVRYMILKGLPLAQAVYGSIGARRCRDIDVLVAPPAFAPARRALAELGFTAEWDLDPALEAVCLRFAADLALHRADGLLVELHDSVDFNPPSAGAAFARSLLATAEPCGAGPVEVPSVVGAAALPYLAWHGANHAWARLFWLYDVAAITARAEEHELAAAWEAAVRLGGGRPLALAWRLCDELLGVPVPPPARRAAASSAIHRLSDRARGLTLGTVGRAPPGTVERRVSGLGWSLALASGPLDRGRLLMRYLVDVRPEEVRSLPLPAWLGWAYPWLRPARVGLRLGAALVRQVTKGRGPGPME